jgi:hypothetical protein
LELAEQCPLACIETIDTLATSQHSHGTGKLHGPDVPLEKPTSFGERPINALIDASFQIQVYDREHAESLPDTINAANALLHLGGVPGQVEINQETAPT